MKPYRFPAFARVSPLLACVTALSPGFAFAANLYWDGSDPADKSWGQSANWSTSSTANTDFGVPIESDIAIFGTSGLNTLQTILLNGDRSVLGISVVNNNASASVGYRLVGGDGNHTLTIGASGISEATGSPGPLTIGSADTGQAVAVILGASQIWQSRSSGQAIFVLNGVSAASSSTILTLTGTNTGSKIEGGITDGTGSVGIAKSDTGTWTLAGNHNFSGGITVDGGALTLTGGNANATSTTVLNTGTINLGNAAALGGGLFTINGGTLNTNGANITLSTNNAQTWNANFTFTGTNNLNLGTGAVSLGTAAGTERTITVGGSTLTVGGIISNGTTANALIKAGSGSLTLSGANLHTGGITLNAGTLNFGNAGALGSGLFTINGGTINTSGGAISISTNNAQTWNANFTFTGTNSLNLGTGAVSLGTAAGTERTITVAGSTLTVGGIISNGTTANALIKAGSGGLTLSGANLHTGGITLNAGTLNFGNAGALGSGLFTINGGTINTSGGAISLSTNNAQTWNANFTFTGTNNLNLGTGAVSLGTAAGTERTITVAGSTLTVGGVISDGTTANALIKAGSGALTLSGANLHTGGTTLNAGTININNATALGTGNFTINAGTINNSSGAEVILSANNTQTWNGNFTFTGSNSLNMGTGAVTLGTAAGTERTVTVSASTLTVGGIISDGTTATGLIKAGTGTLVLSGGNVFTGPTTISNGILSVSSINSVVGGSASSSLGAPVTVANGTIHLGATTTTGQLLYTGGGETTDRVLNLAGTTGGGTVTHNGSGLLKFTSNITATGVGIKNLTLQGTGEGEFAGIISDNSITDTTGIIKSGTGIWTLSGANTYSGRTSISNGILSVSSINSVVGGTAGSSLGAPTTADNGTINLGSGGSTGQLLYTGAGETTDRVLNLAGTTGGGIVTQNGAGLLKFTGNLTATGSGTKTLTLQGTGEGEIAGIIVNSGSATNIAKSGTGTWTLSAANSYTGNTTVNDGILRMAGAGLLSGGNLTMNGGQLDLNGTNQGVAILAGSDGATITNNAPSTTATLTAGNGSGIYAGTLTDGTGTLAFNKTGTGTTTLSGANSYSGATVVTTGILAISHAQGLGATTSGTTVSSGASLALTGGVTVTGESITINGIGSGSTGALRNSSGNNTWDGPVLLGTDSGTAGTGNAARIGSQSGILTVSGVIQNGTTGNVGIRNADSGAGTVVFTGDNTYTGTTHIVVGSLSVSSINSVATNAELGTVHSASSNLGAPTNSVTGTIHLTTTAEQGELIYTGSGETTDRILNLAGTSRGAILTQSGSGSLKFTSDLTATGTGAKTLTLRGSTSATGELAGAIVNGSGTTSVAKTETGTWILSGTNTYSGTTSVTGGTLVVSGGINLSTALSVGNGTFRLGASGMISNTAAVTLNVGGVIETNNFSDQAGILTVTGDATIDLSGTSLLQFADSSGAIWSGLLGITNWSGDQAGEGTERLTFGSSGTGLTPDQLSRIFFTNPEGFDAGTYGAAILSTGEVIPLIPEPSSALLAIASACGLTFRRRRK